jgi:hypothetical protein
MRRRGKKDVGIAGNQACLFAAGATMYLIAHLIVKRQIGHTIGRSVERK